MDKQEANEVRLIKNTPINEYGVILVRSDLGEAITNVPQVLRHDSPTGFDWGDSESGSTDLALNILEYAIMKLGLAKEKRVHVTSGPCTAEALSLHQQFKRDMLEPMKKEGGFLPWEWLVAWLNVNLIAEKGMNARYMELDGRRQIVYLVPEYSLGEYLDLVSRKIGTKLNKVFSKQNILLNFETAIIEYDPAALVSVKTYFVNGEDNYNVIVCDSDDDNIGLDEAIGAAAEEMDDDTSVWMVVAVNHSLEGHDVVSDEPSVAFTSEKN